MLGSRSYHSEEEEEEEQEVYGTRHSSLSRMPEQAKKRKLLPSDDQDESFGQLKDTGPTRSLRSSSRRSLDGPTDPSLPTIEEEEQTHPDHEHQSRHRVAPREVQTLMEEAVRLNTTGARALSAVSPESGRSLRTRPVHNYKSFYEDDYEFEEEPVRLPQRSRQHGYHHQSHSPARAVSESRVSGVRSSTRATRYRGPIIDDFDFSAEEDTYEASHKTNPPPPPPKLEYDLETLQLPEDLQQSNIRVTRRLAHTLAAQSREESAQNGAVDHHEEDDQPERHEDSNDGVRNRLRPRKLISFAQQQALEDNARKEYGLRPRTEPKNYRVRIPLFDASPKKSESRRRIPGRFTHFKHFEGDGYGGSSSFRFNSSAFRSNNSLLLGPSGGDLSSDEDGPSPVKDFRKIASLGSIAPLNKDALGGDDVEKLLLGKRAQGVNGGKSLSDTDPLSVDQSVDFSKVGGLEDHIKSLKEMVLLPLLYPEIFAKFNVTPPRGVIFHGPPGTGKTLLARALANACSTGTQKVAFFMRKGADVLSKWVGESERQLKHLFEQARLMQPSIIFFDEIDGLAPVRSAKQDQIHSSIVTTLLALMDGLDNRGQVVVIGATNRIDSIDSALRRPGRFDREFYFPLPSKAARHEILKIHTNGWEPSLSDDMLSEVTEATKGYCGSDMKSLCTEAMLCALERVYPQIYTSAEKLSLDVENVKVQRQDFAKCIRKMVPASYRIKSSHAAPLSPSLQHLLGKTFSEILSLLKRIFPVIKTKNSSQKKLDSAHHLTRNHMIHQTDVFRPRLLVHSDHYNNGQYQLAVALLNELEGIHVHVLDHASIYDDSSRSPEAALIQFFLEVRRRKPAVIFIPNLNSWWMTSSDLVKNILMDQIFQLDPHDPILVLAVATHFNDESLNDAKKIFEANDFSFNRPLFLVPVPDREARRVYFEAFLLESHTELNGLILSEDTGDCFVVPAVFHEDNFRKESTQEVTSLKKAPPAPPRKLTAKEIKLLHEYDESVFRRLRMFIREFMHEFLRCKDYKSLTKNLNPIEDYGDVIKFDGQDILEKVERNGYQTIKVFRKDIFESLESFRYLSMQRGEMYRLTYVNALVDIVEEWFRVIDPNLVHEANESAQREKRLKKEYDDLRRQKYNEFQQQYQASQSHQHSRLDNEGWDSGTDSRAGGVRTSRRLRGENPDHPLLDGSMIARRQRRITTDDEGPSEQPVSEHPGQIGVDEEKADLASGPMTDDDPTTNEHIEKESAVDLTDKSVDETVVETEMETEAVVKAEEDETAIDSSVAFVETQHEVEAEALPIEQEAHQAEQTEESAAVDADEPPHAPVEEVMDVDADDEGESSVVQQVEAISLSHEPQLIQGFKTLTRLQVEQLSDLLCDKTGGLTVESLEQIRTRLNQTLLDWRDAIWKTAYAMVSADLQLTNDLTDEEMQDERHLYEQWMAELTSF